MSFFEETINSKWFKLVSSNIQGRISVYNEKYIPERINFPAAPFENKLGEFYEGYRTLTKDEKGYCTGVYGGHGALMYFGKDGKYGILGRGSYNFTGESPEPYFSNKVKNYLLKKETGLKDNDETIINVLTNSNKYNDGAFSFNKLTHIPVYKSNATFLYNGKYLDYYLYKNDYCIDRYYFKKDIDKYFEKPFVYTGKNGEVIQDYIKPHFLTDSYDKLFICKLVPYFYTTENENKTLNKAFRIGELVEKEDYDLKYGYKLLTDKFSSDVKDAYEITKKGSSYIIDDKVIIISNLITDDTFINANGDKLLEDYSINEPRVVVYPIHYSNYMKNIDDLYIHVCFTLLEGDYIKSYRGIITGDNCNKYLELLGGEPVGYYSSPNEFIGTWKSDYYTIDTKKIQYKDVRNISLTPSSISREKLNIIKSLCTKIQECDSLDLNNFYSYRENKDLKYSIQEYEDYSLEKELITEVDLYKENFKVLYYNDDIDVGDTITFEDFESISKSTIKEVNELFYDVYVNLRVYGKNYKGKSLNTFRANRGEYRIFEMDNVYNRYDGPSYWFFEEEPLMSFPTNPGAMYYEEIAAGAEVGFTKSDTVYFPTEEIEKTENGFTVPSIDIDSGPKTESIKDKIEQLEKEKEDILNDDSLTFEEKEEKVNEINKKIEEVEKELESEKETSSGGVNTDVEVDVGIIVDENKLGETKLPVNENGDEYIEIEIEIEVVDSNGVKRKIKKKIFLINPRGKNNKQSTSIPLKDLIESYPASIINIKIEPTDKDLVDAIIPEVDVNIKDTNNPITQDENSKKEPEKPINGVVDTLYTDDFFTIRKTKSIKNRVVWTDELGISDEFTIIKNEENI